MVGYRIIAKRPGWVPHLILPVPGEVAGSVVCEQTEGSIEPSRWFGEGLIGPSRWLEQTVSDHFDGRIDR